MIPLRLITCSVFAPLTIAMAQPSQDSVLPERLATISTDTGEFQPGHKDFSRYSSIGFCLAAARTTNWMGQSSLASQQMMLDPQWSMHAAGTPVVGQVADIARACGSHFTVTETSPRDLPWLFDLALAEQNDSLAHAILERRLALATEPRARNNVLLETIGQYLNALPVRLAAADSIVTQCDAHGASALELRLSMHKVMLTFAAAHFDTSEMRKHADAVIVLGRAVPLDKSTGLDGWHKGILYDAYSALSRLAYVEQPDSLLNIAVRGKQDIGRFGDALALVLPDFSSIPIVEVRRLLLSYAPVGPASEQPLPPLQADYWFPHHPDRWPLGEVSIVIPVDKELWCLTGKEMSLSAAAEQCPLMVKVREWAAKYHDRLSVTLVATLNGSTLQSGTLSPDQEAQQLKWYFLDYLKLPVTLAAITLSRQQTTDGRFFACRPDDGWRFCRDSTANRVAYLGPNHLVRVLGEDGRILYQGGFSPTLDAFLARIIGTQKRKS